MMIIESTANNNNSRESNIEKSNNPITFENSLL